MTKRRYQIGTKENLAFLAAQTQSLLAFGHAFVSPGGGSWWLGDDGTPVKEKDRETWITARMVHVYCLGIFLRYSGSRKLAQEGLFGLLNELQDKKHGGWYAAVSRDGVPKGPKQCYAHAFVILAAGSGVLAELDGARELLEEALRVFDAYFWDEETGLALDSWDVNFETPDSYRGLNANMHTVEAFLAASDVLEDEKYRERAGRIIQHVIGWAKENCWRIPEHYRSDWSVDLACNADKKDDPFKPYGATPGHGVEWARLITQWALSSPLEEESCACFLDAAQQLYRRAVSDAWEADGAPGIVYTTDWDGNPVVHDRMHWTLAEAINTSAVLYNVTKKEEYAKDYAAFLTYLDEVVIDHENGSWFHQLNEKNELLTTVWPGKPDLYHAVQAMQIPRLDPSVSIAKALWREQTSN